MKKMAAMEETFKIKKEYSGKIPDDNLLEPLKEVSFSDREKISSDMKNSTSTKSILNNKDPNKTLPDARAKVLHLQRVQRPANSINNSSSSSNSNSNDSSKLASRKNSINPVATTATAATTSSSSASKSNDNGNGEEEKEEKEETVNFSLETIIRRGLTDQKITTNFNNPFKFGKPDDNISLRVNPSANLFYEHSSSTYSDSNSDSDSEAKSPGTTSKSDDNSIAIQQQQQQPIENSENMIPIKRRPGRPKMTEEQKAEKRAQKSILQAQTMNNNQTATLATPVDELMAMGHSIFSEYAPKKRGRPPQRNSLQPYYNANNSIDTHESGHFSDGSPPKKRGRKPKVRNEFMDVYSDVNNHSEVSYNSTAETNNIEKKKRGRKPNFIANQYFVSIPSTNDNRNFGESVPVAKKRGRRPKSYYLALEQQQQQQEHQQQVNDEDIHMSAEEIVHSNDHTTDDETMDQHNATNSSVDEINQSLLSFRTKRGRKPRAYYELLNRKVKLEMNDTATSNSTLERSHVSANTSTEIDNILEAQRKKRGRRPKSYYLALQQQQELMSNPQCEPTARNNSLSLEIIDNDTSVASNTNQSLSDSRVSKSTPKQNDVPKKVMFQEPTIIVRMNIFLQNAIFILFFLVL